MTRRSRRASSAPQQVGSDEGLTSSRPSDAEASEPTKADTRHTPKKVEQTKDDTDVGWGERGDDDASARWLRENRPPHWD
ncbi:hypothetical protein ACOCJ7_13690 [Knoellia sp. CPCC 206453]|uniref:hypothetical protein n=1 Tax=Knoellia pratensis TaxID=3404796 RepID=UPI00360D75C6